MIGIVKSIVVCATLVASVFIAAGVHSTISSSPHIEAQSSTSLVTAADVDARLDVILSMLAQAEVTGAVDSTVQGQVHALVGATSALDGHADAALLVKIRAKLDACLQLLGEISAKGKLDASLVATLRADLKLALASCESLLVTLGLGLIVDVGVGSGPCSCKAPAKTPPCGCNKTTTPPPSHPCDCAPPASCGCGGNGGLLDVHVNATATVKSTSETVVGACGCDQTGLVASSTAKVAALADVSVHV